MRRKTLTILIPVLFALLGCQTNEAEQESNVFDGHFPINSKLEVST